MSPHRHCGNCVLKTSFWTHSVDTEVPATPAASPVTCTYRNIELFSQSRVSEHGSSSSLIFSILLMLSKYFQGSCQPDNCLPYLLCHDTCVVAPVVLHRLSLGPRGLQNASRDIHPRFTQPAHGAAIHRGLSLRWQDFLPSDELTLPTITCVAIKKALANCRQDGYQVSLNCFSFTNGGQDVSKTSPYAKTPLV